MRKIDRKLLVDSFHYNPEGVAKCLEKGANVNAKDEESGMTSAHHAAATGAIEVLDILISNGKIDLSIKDNKGRSPIDLALMFREKCESRMMRDRFDSVVQTIEANQIGASPPDVPQP